MASPVPASGSSSGSTPQGSSQNTSASSRRTRSVGTKLTEEEYAQLESCSGIGGSPGIRRGRPRHRLRATMEPPRQDGTSSSGVTYDAAGNQQQMAGIALQYDGENRQIASTVNVSGRRHPLQIDRTHPLQFAGLRAERVKGLGYGRSAPLLNSGTGTALRSHPCGALSSVQ